ncbi:MAG TPA: hypothetical protein DHW42_06295 [Candidatus Marinimicrobia bacterium]|nr:hypothetical protein [Candidatus Neomarinimicrobiota bacterium]
MRRVRVRFRKTYQRLNYKCIITLGVLFFFTFTNISEIFLTGLIQFWLLIEMVCIAITTLLLYYFGSNLPFYMTKIDLKSFYILGEKKFRKVEKDFLARHPFVRKCNFGNIVLIREYRDDGTLLSETPYNHGQIDGEKKIYTISGKLRRSSMYKSDSLNGYSKKISGDYISLEQYYKNAKLHGITKEYNTETGVLVKEMNYNDNKIDGIMRKYNPINGMLVEETAYKNGIKDGFSKFYYQTGQLKSEIQYKNNIINGIVEIYFKSGVLHSETSFKDGKKDGWSKSYYKTGQLRSEIHYENGLLDGIEKVYYKSGVILSETKYLKNVQKGPTQCFSPDGKLQ